MKIAVTYDNGEDFSAFWKNRVLLKVYEVEDNKIVSSEVIGSKRYRTWSTCRSAC